MNTKLMATFVMGLVLGIAAALFVGVQWPQAQAQGKAKQWEYRVVSFHSQSSVKFAERLNKMAEEGWEYVGVLCTVTSPQAGEDHVAFKRLKN
jgi:hypothetical protein